MRLVAGVGVMTNRAVAGDRRVRRFDRFDCQMCHFVMTRETQVRPARRQRHLRLSIPGGLELVAGDAAAVQCCGVLVRAAENVMAGRAARGGGLDERRM